MNTLKCDMERSCGSAVTHVDSKGYLYCTKHGERRKMGQACRKLQPAEIKKLEQGGTISYRRDPARRASKRFTVEAGRQIYVDGYPFISIHREGQTAPADADVATRIIATMLNAREKTKR